MGNPVFERKRGVIKTILRAKQYGFIHVSDKEEYFFHGTALVQGLKFSELLAGDAVSFIPTTGKENKLRAVAIRKLAVDTSDSSGASSDHRPASTEAGEVRKREDGE